jgi:hypothetical protein
VSTSSPAEEGPEHFARLCAQVLDHARLVFQVRLDGPIDDPASLWSTGRLTRAGHPDLASSKPERYSEGS